MGECKGCVIYNNVAEEGPYDRNGKCPGRLEILISKCPCRICLVKVLCKDGCDLFRDNSIQQKGEEYII